MLGEAHVRHHRQRWAAGEVGQEPILAQNLRSRTVPGATLGGSTFLRSCGDHYSREGCRHIASNQRTRVQSITQATSEKASI